MSNPTWNVLPHDPIEHLSDNLWRVQGSIRGMSLKRNMVVVRLPDGRLVIHNAIALEPAAMQALEAWGTPAFMIIPSGIHRLDAPAYKARYPQLKVYAPAGSRKAAEKVVPVDGTYEDFPKLESVRLERLQGVNDVEGVMIVHSGDGETLVFNDAIFNMDRKTDFIGYLITTLFGSAPGPRVSRLAKLTLIKDKAAMRGQLETLATTPNLQRVIVAHEKVAQGPDARAALQAALHYL